MNIEIICVGMFEVNCVVLWKETDAAWVVDPGENAAEILQFLRSYHLKPAAYLLTHGHVDHISALAEVYKAMPAPMFMHPADLAWAFKPANQLPPYYGPPPQPAAALTPITEGQCIGPERDGIRVLHTPGHSPGGVCYHFEHDKLLICGDTLFKGSVGRSDLPGGDPRILAQSLQRLTTLPDDLQVIPGHGPETTIRRERATNYFLRGELI